MAMLLQLQAVAAAALAAIAQVAEDSMPKHLIIATRGSALALWQANFIKDLLEKENPDYRISLNVIKTRGDIIVDAPLAQVGGKGLFVKEIEEALLQHRADLAVHSIKDVPMQLPEGLLLGCIPKREDPSDCFLSENWQSLADLPRHATVGTSSLRRQAQLLALRPDLQIISLRGNVDTRLRKLKEGACDAIILATAGLYRLGLTTRYMRQFPVDVMIPAVGQGALGIECREDDYHLLVLLASLEDRLTRVCVSAERAFLGALNGGCQVPIAAHAQMDNNEVVTLNALVAKPDGSETIVAAKKNDASFAESVGIDLATEMLARGAKPILQEFYSQN